MKSLFSLNKYFYKYRWRMVLGILFVIISNIFSVLQAPFVGDAIDAVSGKINEEGFTWTDGNRQYLLDKSLMYALLILGAALLKGLFLFLKRQTIIVVSRLIEYDMKNEIFAQYQRLSLSFYRRNNTGDLMNRISEDVSRVRMYIGPAVMYSVDLVVLFIIVISRMLAVDVTFSLYVLLPLPVLSVSIYFVNNLIYRRSDLIQQQLSTITTFAQEAFSGIRVLKAFGVEERSRQAFEKESEEYRVRSMSMAKFDSLFFPLMLLLIGLSNLLTIYIGGREVIRGNITYGNIAEFVIYVNMLTWPVASLGYVTSLIQRAASSQDRINEFMREEPEIVSETPQPFDFRKDIRFDDVSFAYPGAEKYALEDISFDLPKGRTLGIIGATGSGKSTLAALLLRLYDSSKGQVTLDGREISTINLDQYRERLGYVPQDVFLFSDTLEENIAFGLHRDVPDRRQKVEEAARQAAVYHNIVDFPNGFQTLIGERGVTLSGGQKQRVAIARALIKDPDILLLDDCLSAVDTRTESQILDNFKKVFDDKTVIIISHRVSSVKNADEILVLESGRIAERGNHATLVEKAGIYYELHQKQTVTEEEMEIE